MRKLVFFRMIKDETKHVNDTLEAATENLDRVNRHMLEQALEIKKQLEGMDYDLQGR